MISAFYCMKPTELFYELIKNLPEPPFYPISDMLLSMFVVSMILLMLPFSSLQVGSSGENRHSLSTMYLYQYTPGLSFLVIKWNFNKGKAMIECNLICVLGKQQETSLLCVINILFFSNSLTRIISKQLFSIFLSGIGFSQLLNVPVSSTVVAPNVHWNTVLITARKSPSQGNIYHLNC